MNWKITLPCTRKEAEALHDDDEWLASLEPIPSIVADEVEAFNDAKWRIEAYFPEKPSQALIAAIQARVPSAANAKAVVEKLPDEDWLTVSQQGLQPVHAGRFYIHTSDNAGLFPPDSVAFQIDAAQAFGTGGHDTTKGCLIMLDALKRQGKRFDMIADIGTGTGLLAFAARHLWPYAYVTASDIDPISITVTVENATKNDVPLGQKPGQVALCSASGTDHEIIQRRAPYDLIIANILAGPLIELAPAFGAIMNERGTLILAGLLDTQARSVVSAYRQLGFRLERRNDNGDWPCLRFTKRPKYSWERQLRAYGRTSQPPGDFGTW